MTFFSPPIYSCVACTSARSHYSTLLLTVRQLTDKNKINDYAELDKDQVLGYLTPHKQYRKSLTP